MRIAPNWRRFVTAARSSSRQCFPTPAKRPCAFATTGAGMSEKQIAAALEPFADIDAWAKSGAGETEFGLPLTKALAEANHAQFRIKSAPGAGTLVEIAFPSNRTVAN